MSYEKVKNIKIDEKEGKVFINCASNNVIPLIYSYGECTPLSKILQEKGRQELDIEILKIYESGEFQNGNNIYTKALKILYYVFNEEYHKFNWRTNWDESRKVLDTEEGKKEFKELLLKCLNYKFPKQKFVIVKNYGNTKVYGKSCLRCMKWLESPKKASKFDFKKEAEDNIYKNFKDVWMVEELK